MYVRVIREVSSRSVQLYSASPNADTDCPRVDIRVSSRIKLDVKMIDRNARRSPNKAKTSARKGVVISPSARLRNDDTGREGLCEAVSCKMR